MKRVFPSQVNSVHASEADVNADAALPHSALSDGNRRVSSSAATLGLAISVGISGLFVPNQTHSAVAVEPEAARTSTSLSLTDLGADKFAKPTATEIPITGAIESELPAPLVHVDEEERIPVIAPLQDVRVKTDETAVGYEPDWSGESDFDAAVEEPVEKAHAKYAEKSNVREWTKFEPEWNAPSESDVSMADEPTVPAIESPRNADGEIETVVGDAIPNSTPSTIYQVSEGDTIYEIANKYGISEKSLEKLNHLGDPSFLEVGQNLSVPAEKTVSWSDSPAAHQPVYVAARVESTGIADAADNAPMEWVALDPIQPSAAPQLASEPEASSDPYVEDLRADISKLREKYPIRHDAPVSPAAPVVTEPTGSATVSTTETIARQAASLPAWAAPHAHAGIVESPKFAENPASQTSPDETQFPVAAASAGQPAYISPVRVSPKLPNLPEATAYLPTTPGHQQTRPEQEKFTGYVWPAEGELSSPYGWRWGRMHRGIDIAGPIGTPIVAAADGVVSYADWNDGGYGYLVEITHADGSTTLYAHNDRILVNEGEEVAQGQQISEMGSTGFSTGPHLHFEVHHAGEGAVDPIAYLPQ